MGVISVIHQDQMCAAVLHLRDAGVGVIRVPPLGVAAFLRAFPIEPRLISACRCLDARGLPQSRQKLLIRLTRVAPHDAPQGRVRFESRRIDSNGLALHEVGGCQHLQDPHEDRAVRLLVDQSSRPRDRRVLGRCFVEAQPQEAPKRQRVGLDPANGVAAPDDARLYHLSVDTGTGQLPKIAQVDAVAFRYGPQDSWVMREIPLRQGRVDAARTGNARTQHDTIP